MTLSREKSLVAAILLLFWLAMLASLADKSLAFDEALHAPAGFSYWRFGDYGLQPENGNLPQRLAGLPLALGSYKYPPLDSAEWRNSQAPVLGYIWFYELGNDARRMAADGRAACGVLAVLLGAVVWAWSRQLFGPRGAMVSLILYVLNPTILANGALMTSDMAAALFLLAATWAWWAVLDRMSTGRLLGSALLAGGLFVSKTSAVLIIPVMLALAAVRLCAGRPLAVACGPWRREIASRARQAFAFAFALAVHAVVIVAVIWTFYGFRYSAFPKSAAGYRFLAPWDYMLNEPDLAAVMGDLHLSPGQSAQADRLLQDHHVSGPDWSYDSLAALADIRRTVLMPDQGRELDAIRRQPPPNAADYAIDFFRRHELLPEAWLFGSAYVLRASQIRRTFWNGEYSETGWHGFFPYTFLVKTPLSVFGVCGLALLAAWISWKKTREDPGSGKPAAWRHFYSTLPLWALLAVYWGAAISSHLNVGHRHLLPVYAPMFVLCGAAACWLGERGTGFQPVSLPNTGWKPVPLPETACATRWPGAALCALLVLLAAETAWRFPNYRAYFNGIIRPANAYRHLVDSSLDWGQELPAAARYVRQHSNEGPFYLSYFGMASPAYYGIPARLLFSFGGPYARGNPDLLLTKLPSDRVDEEAARLQRERTTYDLMGVGQMGNDVYAVFLKKAGELRMVAGTYLISATMLQPVYYYGPRGPWNEGYEATYRQLEKEVQPLLALDPGERAEAFKGYDLDALGPLLDRFEQYRLARLTAYLREREPDATINYSILVYRLTDADLARALD